MKTRIITLLLSIAVIFTCVPVMNTAAFAAGEQIVIYHNGTPVSTVTLPQNNTVQLDVVVSSAGTFQWQILYGTNWINIEGANTGSLQITYAMIAQLLTGGNARIRCLLTSGELAIASGEVTVSVAQDQMTIPGTNTEQVPEDTEKVNYTVVHYQQNVDGMTYSEIGREAASGFPGTAVASNLAKDLPGFYTRSYDTTILIDEKGTTVIQIYYDRYYYIVNVDLGGGVGETAAFAAYGTTFTIDNPEKEGYIFNGWSQMLPAAMPIGGVTITAQWIKSEAGAVTVVYWYETITEGEYTQVGQYVITDAEVGDVITSSEYATAAFSGRDDLNFSYNVEKEEQITLTDKPAQLNVYFTRNKYQLIYIDNILTPNGNEVVKTIEVPFDTPLSAVYYVPDYETELSQGYVFDGWYTQAGIKMVFEASTMPAEDLLLTAKWTPNTYLVSFYRSQEDMAMNALPILDPQTVQYGKNATASAVPLDEDYTFIGWYTRVNGIEVQFDFNTKITSDVNLYAKWELTVKNAPVSVVHYIQNLDGTGYTEYHREENPMGVVGKEYSVNPLIIEGFEYNPSVMGTLVSGKLTKTGLQLQLYYDRNLYTYEVQYIDYDTQKPIKASLQNVALYGKQIHVNAEEIDGYTIFAETTKSLTIQNNEYDRTVNTVIFYYQEESATIRYEIIGPDGCAELSLNHEEIKILTGAAIGSMPIYTEQYQFIGWFTDPSCTVPVSDFLVKENGLLIPQVGFNGKYEDCIYYAKLEYNRTDLTIYKTVSTTDDEEQSFIFHIIGSGNDYLTKDVSLTVVVSIGAGQNSGSITIKDLPVGNYTVQEQYDWNWRYSSSDGNSSIYLYPDVVNQMQTSSRKNIAQWLSCAVYYKKQFTD